MPDDIETRILQEFEVRLEAQPDVSSVTVEALLDEQRDTDFGDGKKILQQIVDRV